MKIFISIVFICFCSISSIDAQNMDINLLRKINVNRNEKLDPAFVLISKTVTPVNLIAPLELLYTGLILKDSTLTRKSLVIVATAVTSAVAATVLKHAFNKTRPFNTYPDIEKVDGGGSPSFPSGHTSDAFSIATSVSLAFPKWYVIAPAYAWASAVGYSRMHLGVHYPSDVLGGMIVGAGAAFLCYEINKCLHKRKK